MAASGHRRLLETCSSPLGRRPRVLTSGRQPHFRKTCDYNTIILQRRGNFRQRSRQTDSSIQEGLPSGGAPSAPASSTAQGFSKTTRFPRHTHAACHIPPLIDGTTPTMLLIPFTFLPTPRTRVGASPAVGSGCLLDTDDACGKSRTWSTDHTVRSCRKRRSDGTGQRG